LSDCVIDGQRLQADTQAVVENLNTEGYEVVSITAISSGRHTSREAVAGASWGYGYSLTEGVIVLARQVP
jgi:hypothetical protein